MSRAKLTHILSRDVRGTRISTAGLTEVLCSIATVSERNRAHINTAYFCYSDDLVVYFVSHPNSLHCRNLSRSSPIGMTIFSSSQPWGSPGRGLQLFGRCQQATAVQAKQAERLYAKRFPAYGSWKATVKRGDAGGQDRFYRFVVRTVRILDEEV